MKGLGGEKKHLQHNIVELFIDIPTIPDNEAFTVNRHKHTHTHTKEANGSADYNVW